MNERIRELEKQLQDAWLAYCKVNGMGHPLHSMNRDTYAIFKDGWNAALAAMVEPEQESQCTSVMSSNPTG